MQSRDEQLGSAIRRIAQRFPGHTEKGFEWYIDALLRDAERLQAGPMIEWVSRSRLAVEPSGPPHIDGMLERLLEMITGEAATGVTSPFSGQIESAKGAMRDAGLPDTMTPADAIFELAQRCGRQRPPAEVLADWGWSKSHKPNTYLPKPVSVWVHEGSGSTVLVHRGRVDTSSCDAPFELAELRAFADLAEEVATVEPVVTETRVRILVWFRSGSARAACLDIDDGGLLSAVRESPIELLDASGQFGSPDDPRPYHARSRPGLWIWNGIATSTSRSEETDDVCLLGEWLPVSDADAASLGGAGVALRDLPKRE